TCVTSAAAIISRAYPLRDTKQTMSFEKICKGYVTRAKNTKDRRTCSIESTKDFKLHSSAHLDNLPANLGSPLVAFQLIVSSSAKGSRVGPLFFRLPPYRVKSIV